MRIFLHEYVTGGGFLAEHDLPPASLRAEGGAMVAALAADFATAGIEVLAICDSRLDRESDAAFGPGVRVCQVATAADEAEAFDTFAATADWTVVIAPETGGRLLGRCRRAIGAGGRLLGPAPAVVEIASDKQATADLLSAAGVPTPSGATVTPGQERLPADRWPAVGKPRCGAGSEGVRLLPDRVSAEAWLRGLREPGRIEDYRPGLAASVAFLCGPTGRFPLVPCRQHLSDDGRFVYLGGSLPLDPPLARRAAALASRAIGALPGPMGFLGVDLVLGPDPLGAGDAVIEVNPRLTTSYVGLRAAAEADGNLAAALLDAFLGRPPRLSFRPRRLQFDATGAVQCSGWASTSAGRT